MRIFDDDRIEPQNRFDKAQKRIKANFNNDLLGVAADKVKNLELASTGSHDSVISNG